MSIISYIKAIVEVITGFNEIRTFSEWFRSPPSQSNETENQEVKEDYVLKLRRSLECLRDNYIPAMNNFIDLVEWRSHEDNVAELLPKLKAAVYDAEDLLEDFQCYEQKLKIEGSGTSAEPDTKFFRDNFSKLTHIKERLDIQFRLLEMKGLHQVTPRFDRNVRLETTIKLTVEEKVFGRDEEINKLIKLLVVPATKNKGPSTRKRPRSQNTKDVTKISVPVLPIVGIGGVGKTTLAQSICNHPQVSKHFGKAIIWVCVSDDFDVKRLTKEAIEQFSRNATMKNNLNSLQADLADILKKRRFLIVLDDMWAENKELWVKFYASFKDVVPGSMMLVTTRSRKVADIVGTMDPFLLKGLKENVFLDFFKLCVFGSGSSNNNPELIRIAEQILPKLKGSPLAAKTLGRLLGTSLDTEHWNMILNSELWEHRQEANEILPALRLSYIYLPSHLKRCFSFCAVYPKDYNFVKEDLAEIWAAEGFVEPQGNIPLHQTGCDYFEELAHLSFFQKLRRKYVIHDLIHDMAQLVSKDECFIIKDKKDLERIPQNVRHLSVLKVTDLKRSDLKSLCKQTKLRTLLCEKSLKSRAANTVVEKWCTELLCMRVMVCASVSRFGLPDSISNMKNLRCLKILDPCKFKCLPRAFCCLYNLQLFCASKCRFEEVPRGFSNLINLQKFESKSLRIEAGALNKFNLITEDLSLCNLSEINKDQAAEIELKKNKYIFNLTLTWSPEDNHDEEVFKALNPPINIKTVHLKCYPGGCLPRWFHGSDDPANFSSLTEIKVTDCPRLSSLEQFLQPAYMPPSIKKIEIKDCTSLKSVPVERFRGLPSLEELVVENCPKINSQCLLGPSLKSLHLDDSGNLVDNIDCSSLTDFHLSRYHLASLTLNREKLPLLTKLFIGFCEELETLNGSWPNLKSLFVWKCPRLKWENGTVLPSSLQKLNLNGCGYFSARCLENLTSLESLYISECKHIEYIPRGLWSCNLKSLQELQIRDCENLVSIGGLEAIAHIPKVGIQNCPKLTEV